jgi:hypothetical protein
MVLLGRNPLTSITSWSQHKHHGRRQFDLERELATRPQPNIIQGRSPLIPALGIVNFILLCSLATWR